MKPLSIPSPPLDWQVFDLAAWLRTTFGWNLPFGIQIHAYAICLLVGMVAAAYITHVRLSRRGAERGVVLDIGIWAIVLGIIGARAWHVFTHPDDYFSAGKTLLDAIAIWNGGLAIFGAVLGGAIGAFIGCRLTGIRFWSFADALAPGIIVGQAIGRLGNYFNHELYGWPTDLPWGLQIESSNAAYPVGLPDGTLFHPTFLYEIVWNTVGAILIWQLGKRLRLQWGKTWAVYLIWYGAGRAVFETIRVDPSELFLGIRSNVWGSFLAIAVGLILFAVQSRRHAGDEPSVYVPGRGPKTGAAVDSEDVYPDDDGDDAEGSTHGAPELATSGAGARA